MSAPREEDIEDFDTGAFEPDSPHELSGRVRRLQPWEAKCPSCALVQDVADLRDGCCRECDAPVGAR